MDTRKDYYAVLGVLPTAEDIVIRAAYRALAQRYHPDRVEGTQDEATARMIEINEAYRILSDAVQRVQYDKTRDLLGSSGEGSSIGGSALTIDSNTAFEAEQFRAFAEKLHEWGYDESAIFEALTGRGVRPLVAKLLARTVSTSQ